MRVVRVSCYGPMEGPLTMVMRESDLQVTIEEFVERTFTPGAFVAHEVFEVDPAPSILEATVEAGKRMTARYNTERDMALLYHWDGEALAKVLPEGVVAATKAAPLTNEEVECVLLQLAKHPLYKNQKVVVISKTNDVISMQSGKVTWHGH